MAYYIYDIESYPNIFTCAFQRADNPEKKRVFEISTRMNESVNLYKTLRWMEAEGHSLIGFNNFMFDYPVIHEFLTKVDLNLTGAHIAEALHNKVTQLINTPFNLTFGNVIWSNDQIIKQIDLFKIHHFDNKAKMTSLKILEFNMRSPNIKDLPYKPNTILEEHEMDVLKTYNQHDVSETAQFYGHSLPQIAFREELSERYKKDMMNDNDMKIGKNYFIMRLEEKFGSEICFTRGVDGREPRQTIRETIDFGEIIFPCVQFESRAFNSVKKWIENQVISETKGAFIQIPLEKVIFDSRTVVNITRRPRRMIATDNVPADDAYDLSQFIDQVELANKVKASEKPANAGKEILIKNLHCYYNDFRFDFGTGGLHGSLTATTIKADKPDCGKADKDQLIIIDADVTSYYPSIVVENGLHPEHLGEAFAEIYGEVKTMRLSYDKGTPENAMLKLALNAAGFGDTNNRFSPFYDPQLTMTITINGQLMLAMLVERLQIAIPSLQMIQANTDGITTRLRKGDLDTYYEVCKGWENDTLMDLEYVEYSRMFLRDVNNYIAETVEGKMKYKGAYGFDLQWHQNHSSLVVQKAVNHHLIEGGDIKEFIINHEDQFDFCLRAKIPRSSKLLGLTDTIDDPVNADLPDFYKNADESDRYAIEQVGLDGIHGWYHSALDGNVEIGEGVRRWMFAGRELDINARQFGLGVQCIESKLPDQKTVIADQYQNVSRYYIAKDGVSMKKVMPPLNTPTGGGWRYLSINGGWKVKECNDIEEFDFDNIDHDWYIQEAFKLVDPLRVKRNRIVR